MEQCPVMNDLYRPLAEEEKREARAEAIEQRACEIEKAEALSEMTDEERQKMALNLRTMLFISGTPESMEYARIELRRLLWNIKLRIAEERLEKEAAAAEEAAAIEAWEAWHERCESWA